jgi:hypothetical protein
VGVATLLAGMAIPKLLALATKSVETCQKGFLDHRRLLGLRPVSGQQTYQGCKQLLSHLGELVVGHSDGGRDGVGFQHIGEQCVLKSG